MRVRVIVASTLVVLVACGNRPEPVAAETRTVEARPPVQTSRQFGDLDSLLAPIALYPDSLLAQILLSAGDPAKVTELDTWLQNNKSLKGTALQDAAVKAGFEPSLVALTLFPTVVSKMAVEIDWTTQLGQAFTANKTLVFDSIQKLRHQAQSVGTLKDSAQQDVETRTTSAGQDVIVIEPTNPQIVYVPQYNTTTVYTQAPTTTTIIVEDDNTDEAVAAGLIGFTAGIAIGAAFDNDYYYGPYGMHGGGYMYNDAWDDYYDHREDAREDWMDHREDMGEERSDRVEDRGEQRSDRTENRTDAAGDRASSSSASTARTGERAQTAQQNRASGTQAGTQQAGTQRAGTQQAGATQAQPRTGSTQARGYSDGATTRTPTAERSGGKSDAFSGYSSGKSQRAASSRGQSSRGASRGGGGRRR